MKPKIALSVETMGDRFPIKSTTIKQWIKLSIVMKDIDNVDCASQFEAAQKKPMQNQNQSLKCCMK